MADYSVSLKASAVKELERLPRADLDKVLRRIEALKNDPRPAGYTKLAISDLYRVRQGDYRIVYLVDDKGSKVEVVKIGHRGDVYR